MFDAHSLMQVQARAFNAHDLETLVAWCAVDARCVRDGELLGEGPQAVRDGIEAEYRTHDPVVRMVELDGEPVLAECCGDEGRDEVTGVVRFIVDDDGVQEVRIDHATATLALLARP